MFMLGVGFEGSQPIQLPFCEAELPNMAVGSLRFPSQLLFCPVVMAL